MDPIQDIITNQQFVGDSLSAVILNLLLCAVLVSLVAWFYKNYSRSLGGKEHVGSILPLIGLTVFMVITVVKSSLALSLGLVGALSIVRFRTPIKEPEELGYLFLTIAIGLGCGAGFKLITIVTTLFVLGYIFLTNNRKNSSSVNGEYTMVIKTNEKLFDQVNQTINSRVISSKVIRLETNNESFTAFINMSLSDNFNFQSLIENLKSIDSDVEVDLVESGVNW